MHQLVLASQSPRRKELLEKAGFEFHTLTVEVSEILEKNLTLEASIMSLARKKSQAALDSPNLLNFKNFLLLTADTVVALESDVLGKPGDGAQAVEFLSRLSGKTHRVITAVCLVAEGSDNFATDFCSTTVHFRKLSSLEIQDYVASGEPMDKAGAYAIQGGARKFVTSIEGPLDNVIGLPVSLIEKLMRENGWTVRRKELV